MELQFLDSSKKMKLSAEIFNCDFNEALIHQTVTAFLAGGRAGTHAQKTRAEVRGGGIKPWRQKGTGRARAGTIRSPLWRKGGIIFAAKPRNYQQKVNKKAYRVALRSIFSELIRQDRMAVVEAIALTSSKTKDLLALLTALLNAPVSHKAQRILLIIDALDDKLLLASRNLPYVEVRESINVDPVVLVNADKVVATQAALKRIEEWLK